MSLVTRSFSAMFLFVGLLLCAWLAPGPSEDLEVGGSMAYAGVVKSKKTAAKRPASAATAKHHVNIKNAMKSLHHAKHNLAQTPVPYGGRREMALREIDDALHHLRVLEHHLRHLHKKK